LAVILIVVDTLFTRKETMDMDGQLFTELYQRVAKMARVRRRPYEQYSDLTIALVYLWSVLHDRPQGWGCTAENWDIEIPFGSLPSESCLSRRLNTPAVKELLNSLCDGLWGRFGTCLAKAVDGKPLLVSKSSTDKTAKLGPAGGGQLSKGYKLHAIVDGAGMLLAWAVAPMNHGESTVAKKLVRRLKDHGGYLAGDSNYDYNALYATAAAYGHQLVAPPKRKGKGLGHMVHSPHRLRGLDLLTKPLARELAKVRRTSAERFFGNLGWRAGGLSQLPGFVRSLPRVRRFVQGKLIFQAIAMEEKLELR
jgi:hypothetical protein